mmetsp:Transcript_11508/g.29465  ORF Transcript_11508/g.29465 Transcript_11508/m.29465 type:complete len:268 (-) Transcript_11508:320-1123(-)
MICIWLGLRACSTFQPRPSRPLAETSGRRSDPAQAGSRWRRTHRAPHSSLRPLRQPRQGGHRLRRGGSGTTLIRRKHRFTNQARSISCLRLRRPGHRLASCLLAQTTACAGTHWCHLLLLGAHRTIGPCRKSRRKIWSAPYGSTRRMRSALTQRRTLAARWNCSKPSRLPTMTTARTRPFLCHSRRDRQPRKPRRRRGGWSKRPRCKTPPAPGSSPLRSGRPRRRRARRGRTRRTARHTRLLTDPACAASTSAANAASTLRKRSMTA